MSERCELCGGEVEEEELSDEEQERLDGSDARKLVCQDCGHTAYVED